MSYSIKKFCHDLLEEIERGYEIKKISRWAYLKLTENYRDIDPILEHKILQVVAMEEGSEFEMTEAEIRIFATQLISGPT